MVETRLAASEHHTNDYELEDGLSILQDIQRMLNNEAFYDMVFVCGDEQEEVGACRMLVASRSPMLESLLLGCGMIESQRARIYLPSIDASTMCICLEFLYTDTVQESSWHSVLSAMKVVDAAMFFLLIRLERLAIAYMHRTSFGSQFEGDEWILGIITAYNLGIQLEPVHLSMNDTGLTNMSSLLDKFRVYVQNLIDCDNEKLFSECNYEHLVYKNLSELAFAHILQHSERDALEQPFAEYFTFLHLVRWTVLRIKLHDASINENALKNILNRCIPRSLGILRSSVGVDVDDKEVRKMMKLLSVKLSQTLQRFPLNFAKIPTDILCRFIEPMCVIPVATLLSIFRTKALSLEELSWDSFAHATKYKVDEYDSSVISCSRRTLKGFARCSTYLITAKNTFFEWEIAVLTRCHDLRIGFYICRSVSINEPLGSRLVLGKERGSWALGSDGNLHDCNLDLVSNSTPYVDAFHDKEEVVVQVHLDMANGNCSFTINGKEAGVAWQNLPFKNQMVFPAVSLSNPGKVQVRRVIRSWMESPCQRLHISNLEDS